MSQPALSPELLAIIRCPKCLGTVALLSDTEPQGPGLACKACKLVYPIVDGLPHFLIEEARPLE